MKRTKALESVAHHEAGHAFAAFHRGVRIKKLTIVPDGDAAGRMTNAPYFGNMNPEFDDSPRVQRRLENMALVCLAGPAAQKRFNPRGYRHWHGEGDVHQAVDLLSYISPEPDELGALWSLMEIRARNMVSPDNTWQIIKFLAERLLEKETMFGKQVRETIYEAYRTAVDQKSGRQPKSRLK